MNRGKQHSFDRFGDNNFNDSIFVQLVVELFYLLKKPISICQTVNGRRNFIFVFLILKTVCVASFSIIAYLVREPSQDIAAKWIPFSIHSGRVCVCVRVICRHHRHSQPM